MSLHFGPFYASNNNVYLTWSSYNDKNGDYKIYEIILQDFTLFFFHFNLYLISKLTC